jgi:hypothetical protein
VRSRPNLQLPLSPQPHHGRQIPLSEHRHSPSTVTTCGRKFLRRDVSHPMPSKKPTSPLPVPLGTGPGLRCCARCHGNLAGRASPQCLPAWAGYVMIPVAIDPSAHRAHPGVTWRHTGWPWTTFVTAFCSRTRFRGMTGHWPHDRGALREGTAEKLSHSGFLIDQPQSAGVPSRGSSGTIPPTGGRRVAQTEQSPGGRHAAVLTQRSGSRVRPGACSTEGADHAPGAPDRNQDHRRRRSC